MTDLLPNLCQEDMNAESEKVLESSTFSLVQCMAVSRGESVLVITDEELREVGYAFWEEARELGRKLLLWRLSQDLRTAKSRLSLLRV